MPATDKIQTVDDARELARRRLPRLIYNFVDGAAGGETAMALNRSDLDQIRLLPRVLVNVDGQTIGKSLLGRRYDLPFGISPMGMCALAWPDADQFLARAATSNNIPVGVSTASSLSLEQYHQQAADNAWFQLYFNKSVAGTLELADRAAKAGYQHLVFTVDTPVLSHRPREFSTGFKIPFTMGPRQFIDCALHPNWSLSTLAKGVPQMANFAQAAKAGQSGGFDRTVLRGTLDFTFLEQLREQWPGKLILKGVMAPADAQRIQQAGADAIWVSNHGGRQLDSAPSAISALAPIRRAVGPDFPILFDSGVRSGDGIVKALALGADYVMMGRPYLYAMAAGGQAGLQRVIDLLKDDVGRTLAQIGLRDINKLDASVIVDPSLDVTGPISGSDAAQLSAVQPETDLIRHQA